MSDIQKVEQKIDSHIEAQREHNTRQERSAIRMELSLDKMSEAITTFVGFQARAEERHLNDKEWQKSVEAHQDKQDSRIDRVEDVSSKNALLVNGAVGALSLIVGSGITWLFTQLGG